MTVRISKPPIDLRSKLSELERPIGLKGGEIMTVDTAQEARELIGAGRKNLLINGDMRISQRGTSFTNQTGDDTRYYLDRWKVLSYNIGTAEYSVEQSTDAPDGFSYSAKYSCTTTESTPNDNAQLNIDQSIEGYNVSHVSFFNSDPDYLTASFWVKSNTAGKYGFTWKLADNGSSEGNTANEVYGTDFTINSPNTWEKKTITTKLSPLTTKTKTSDNRISITIMIWLHAGPARNNLITEDWRGNPNQVSDTATAINFLSSTNNNFYLTGVQLEVGKNATDFEHRSYGEELALCQRYYWELGSYNTDRWAPVALFLALDGTRSFGAIPTPVTMRTNPDIAFNNLNLFAESGTNVDITDLFRYAQVKRYSEFDGLGLQANVASGLTAGKVYRFNVKNVSGTSGYIRFSAEL